MTQHDIITTVVLSPVALKPFPPHFCLFVSVSIPRSPRLSILIYVSEETLDLVLTEPYMRHCQTLKKEKRWDSECDMKGEG